MTKDTYFLSTGEIDRERLTILSEILNPHALQFMKESGLKPGMTVLEFGCGTGHMACELAKAVGPTGKIIATDFSEAQLDVARETAKAAGIHNIEFKCCDVRDIASLNTQFDFAYGRWVIFFTPNPEETLAGLHATLAAGGTLCYESLNFEDHGHFSFPHQSLLEEWHQICLRNANALNLETNLASHLYSLFKKCHFKNLKIKTHQPVLITPKEKSVYRLGLLTSKDFMLKHSIMNETEWHEICQRLSELEQNPEVICGFFRNILVSGKK